MNKSNMSLGILSIALLLVLPNCLQTQQDVTSQQEEIETMNNNDDEITFSDHNDNQEDTTTRRYHNTSTVKLFIYPVCPYCQRVMASLRDSGNINKVMVLDASIPKYLAELKRLTNGNTQCPFIFDEEKNIKMHESQDIIKYLNKRFAA